MTHAEYFMVLDSLEDKGLRHITEERPFCVFDIAGYIQTSGDRPTVEMMDDLKNAALISSSSLFDGQIEPPRRFEDLVQLIYDTLTNVRLIGRIDSCLAVELLRCIIDITAVVLDEGKGLRFGTVDRQIQCNDYSENLRGLGQSIKNLENTMIEDAALAQEKIRAFGEALTEALDQLDTIWEDDNDN